MHPKVPVPVVSATSPPIPRARGSRGGSSNEPNHGGGYKIAVRFGDQVLQAGFTSVPNLVLNNYAQLDMTPAEMMFVIHMWQFRWTERNPYPSLSTIAAKMNVSWRQAHRYASSLKQKGFLRIRPRLAPGRGQVTSEYDFEPLLRAVLELDKRAQGTQPKEGQSTPMSPVSEGGMTNLTAEPLSPLSDEEYAGEKDAAQEDAHLRSIRKDKPGTGRLESQTPRQLTGLVVPVHRPEQHALTSPESVGSVLLRRTPARPSPDEVNAVLEAYIASFAQDLSDRASLKSSTTRALHLFSRSGLSVEGFVQRMYQARSITKERSSQAARMGMGTRGRGVRDKTAGARNKMAYFFACLEDLLGLRAAAGDTIAGVQKSS
jgi:hypothetical protein